VFLEVLNGAWSSVKHLKWLDEPTIIYEYIRNLKHGVQDIKIQLFAAILVVLYAIA
jgi:hypothetical protein